MEFFFPMIRSAVAMIADPCWDNEFMDLLFIALSVFHFLRSRDLFPGSGTFKCSSNTGKTRCLAKEEYNK